MSATVIVAWWGAVLSTIVFCWDIYKWRSAGARFRISASSNMMMIGGGIPDRDDRHFVVLTVSNIGSKKTTITHMVGFHYANRWQRLRKKPSTNFVVSAPSDGQPIPYGLEPGARWMGMMDQGDKVIKMSRKGLLFVGIYHSIAETPLLVQVLPIPDIPERAKR